MPMTLEIAKQSARRPGGLQQGPKAPAASHAYLPLLPGITGPALSR